MNFQEIDEFSGLRISPDGEPVGFSIERGSITPDMAKLYWQNIRKAEFVDFANIIYYSLLLLKRRPEILDYVASKSSARSGRAPAN